MSHAWQAETFRYTVGPMISRQGIWVPLLAMLMGSAGSAQIFLAADSLSALEEGGGALTGPMVGLALMGAMILSFGAVAQVWFRRTGLAASLIGLALVLPLSSWLSASGMWCSALGGCSGDRPLFHLDGYNVVSIILALASIGLQARRQAS